MALTDIKIRSAKPKEKDEWLTDSFGLRLLVTTKGAKYWRLKYRYKGKQKTLALGVYPAVSLKAARDEALKARQLILSGTDPSEERKKAKQLGLPHESDLFSNLARSWWHHQKGTWTDDHSITVWNRLLNDAIPFLDAKPASTIESQDIIHVIKRVEERGATDVASRVLQDIRRTFSHATQMGVIKHNPAFDLTGILKPTKLTHRPSLPRNELPQFLNDLNQYEKVARPLTVLALRLLLLTFLRSGELRGARWDEIDINQKIWRIPADRMKEDEAHVVPLSKQSIATITEIRKYSGQYELLFPSERNRSKTMSENTLGKAINAMGYDGKKEGKSKATPHGFRNTASSILNEAGFNPDAVERQLSHLEKNKVRAAYTHHAQYLEERTTFMQWWADFLDAQMAINESKTRK